MTARYMVQGREEEGLRQPAGALIWHLEMPVASTVSHPKELSALRREKKRRSAGHFCYEIVFELNTEGRGALPELPRCFLRLLQTIDKVLGLWTSQLRLPPPSTHAYTPSLSASQIALSSLHLALSSLDRHTAWGLYESWHRQFDSLKEKAIQRPDFWGEMAFEKENT